MLFFGINAKIIQKKTTEHTEYFCLREIHYLHLAVHLTKCKDMIASFTLPIMCVIKSVNALTNMSISTNHFGHPVVNRTYYLMFTSSSSSNRISLCVE